MVEYKKFFSLLFAVFLTLLIMTSCNKRVETPPVYDYIQTEDIAVAVKETVSSLEFNGYDVEVTTLNVSVPNKPELSDAINTALSKWEQYAISQTGILRAQLKEQGSEINIFRVKNTVTYNHNGLLSIGCFIEYSEYGESFSVVAKSTVWDLAAETVIPALNMLRMSDTDYENFLTVNIDHNLNIYNDKLPSVLKNAAGSYSTCVEYYIQNGKMCLYTSYDNMDYTFGYTLFDLEFKDDPRVFNYDISVLEK